MIENINDWKQRFDILLSEGTKRLPPAAVKKFGQMLFGEYFDTEPDTPIEKKYFDKLIDFIRGEYTAQAKDRVFISAFKDLQKYTKYYPDILKPPKSILYRATRISTKEMANILRATNKNWDKIKDDGWLKVKYLYNPKSEIQSWTTDRKVAKLQLKMFKTRKLHTQNYVPIILQARPKPKELLFNPEFLNDVGGKVSHGVFDENEVIRIGNKIQCQDVFVHVDQLNFEMSVDRKERIETAQKNLASAKHYLNNIKK